jgi:hypothetical protein
VNVVNIVESDDPLLDEIPQILDRGALSTLGKVISGDIVRIQTVCVPARYDGCGRRRWRIDRILAWLELAEKILGGRLTTDARSLVRHTGSSPKGKLDHVTCQCLTCSQTLKP